MSSEQTIDYKSTLNLPKTDFQMKADATNKEVKTQQWWEDNNIYEKNLAQKNVNHKFILHDGPPYLSSDKIHIGTAMNKILKDIVVKYKSQKGYYSPYVPGYDGHGLPIENAVVKNIKGGRASLSVAELRAKCREFAKKNLDGQEANFKRLGVAGHWAEPYVTIAPEFEATQIRVFGDIHKNGYIYKGLKPVYWCACCETALAEAEVEYEEHTSHSVYVKFLLSEEEKNKVQQKANANTDKQVAFVIWTTTPWTLPSNLAISLHPEFDYVLVDSAKFNEVLIIGKELLPSFTAQIEMEESEINIVGQLKGKDLELINAIHPFIDRNSVIILGEHVTTEAGTGCVHTAPGHGLEDYEVAMKYKIGVISPLDNKGVFTNEVPFLEGVPYYKANAIIVDTMKDNGSLIKHGEIAHNYPHCWRCKKPVIYRATEQWFVNVEKFRDNALKEINNVKWIPASGHTRIYNMVESRSDWCISRQRAWGVPIPVFYCQKCNKELINPETITKIADIFETESSDAWWIRPEEDFIPAGTKCDCGNETFYKETDIMDVWFDSGVTHAAVCDKRFNLLRGTPVEMYLEGSDQHRGWFQTSLLTSVSAYGKAPYKSVLTHGFVLDGNGRKMSKSLGNVVDPQKIVGTHGADVLRMWVASVDYTNDVRISDTIVKQLVEVYKKVRNTCRFMLGNLHGFDPATDSIPYDQLTEIDKYILHKLQVLKSQISASFDSYEFYKYYQLIQNFAAVDLSSQYFDIVKDTLYTANTKSTIRRGVQTVLNQILQDLVRILVPVTPHLAEDIWQHVEPQQKNNVESVIMTDWPEVNTNYINDSIYEKWQRVFQVRDLVTKTIEPVRTNKIIGSSLESSVFIYASDTNLSNILKSLNTQLNGIFITSQVILIDNQDLPNGIEPLNNFSDDSISVYVAKAFGTKCERCWKYSETIGSNAMHKTICSSCIESLD